MARSLEESMLLMEELRRLYSADDDAVKIMELRQMRAQIQAIFEQREAGAAQILHEWTQRVAKVEARVAAAESSEVQAARCSALEAAKEAALGELERLGAEASELSAEQQALAAQRASLAGQRVEVNEAARRTEVELRQHLQLYKLLTNLTWDTQAPPGRCKGHVVDSLAADVRTFDLPTDTLSRVERADALWAHISG